MSQSMPCPACGLEPRTVSVDRAWGREVFATLIPAGAPAGGSAQSTVLLRELAALVEELGDGAREVRRTWYCGEPLPQVASADPPPTSAASIVELAPCCDRCVVVLDAHLVVVDGSAAAGSEPVTRASGLRAGESGGLAGATPDVRELRVAGVAGDPSSGSFDAECDGMFARMGELLALNGMTERDVVRTWIYLRDIERDYDAFNRSRRDAMQRAGVSRLPSSTGVGGAPRRGDRRCEMSFHAVAGAPGASPDALRIDALRTPTLNEASEYGSFFSRGLRLQRGGDLTLIVSGTAAVDERGRSRGEGLEEQTDRTLENIDGLLSSGEGGPSDVVRLVSYLKRAADAPRYRELLELAGYGAPPHAIVRADICRPELLCETEATACPRAVPG